MYYVLRKVGGRGEGGKKEVNNFMVHTHTLLWAKFLWFFFKEAGSTLEFCCISSTAAKIGGWWGPYAAREPITGFCHLLARARACAPGVSVDVCGTHADTERNLRWPMSWKHVISHFFSFLEKYNTV